MWKPKTLDNILLDVENESVDGTAYVEYRLAQFKCVDGIDDENKKLIVKRAIDQIPQNRQLRKDAGHGNKFKGAGKDDDEFTHFLLSLFQSFYKKHGRYPRNKEVVTLLERELYQGFIHTIDDEEIEWGERKTPTKLSSLYNRLTGIRKKITDIQE